MIYQGKMMKITFHKLILSAAVCLLVFSGCSNLTLELKKAPANKQLASGGNPSDPGANPSDPGANPSDPGANPSDPDEPSPARHVVTFNSKGGTTVQTVFVQDGEAIPEPQQKPTKSDSAANGGNEFIGWYADEACTTPWDFKQTISGDTTLYANWMPEWISIGNNKWATRNVQGSLNPAGERTIDYNGPPAFTAKISSPGQFYLWAGETGFAPDCWPQDIPYNPPQSWVNQPVPAGWKIPSAADFNELLKVSAPNPGTDAAPDNLKGFFVAAGTGPDGARGIWLGPTCTTAVNGKNPDHTENIFLPLNGYFYGNDWIIWGGDLYVSETDSPSLGNEHLAGFLYMQSSSRPGFYMAFLPARNGGLLRPVKSN